MTLSENSGDYVVNVGKVLPPLAVTSASATGLSLQDWVYIVTIVYTVLQIASLIWKWFKNRNAT